MLKITLVKSVIGNKPVNRRTVAALGLRKIRRTVYKEDNASIRGMIHNVAHLVKVEEVDAAPKVEKKAKRAAMTAPKAKAEAPVKVAKPAEKRKPAAKKAAPKKSPAKKPATKKPVAKKAAKKPAATKPSPEKKKFADIGSKKSTKKKE